MVVGAGSGVLRTGRPENLEVVCVMRPSREKWVGDSCFFSAAITALTPNMSPF